MPVAGTRDGPAEGTEMTISVSLPVSHSGMELMVLPCHLYIPHLQL